MCQKKKKKKTQNKTKTDWKAMTEFYFHISTHIILNTYDSLTSRVAMFGCMQCDIVCNQNEQNMYHVVKNSSF